MGCMISRVPMYSAAAVLVTQLSAQMELSSA